ncbi:hypothetical protein GOBAR_AA01299 [Gossypium barbadense]|uniref:non-specific serine/threonine protein kinase n=1 Tax=Gossypium barbadense TaxID=3634 RepID=A0A2P5YUN3_GOSBA|nr:hypothetical protein GOBAR_AA01299 [Gossypium barbadense]
MLSFSYSLPLFLCFISSFNGIFAATEFDFGTLNLSSLKLLGDAHLNNGSVRLTRDLQVPASGAGRALYSKPVRFREPQTHSPCSFSTFFSFYITNLNPSSIGGGLAFVISPDGDFIGAGGGSLGLLDDKGRASGFVAVEFDTLMDVEFDDFNGNHVGLDLNSMVSSQVGDLGALDVDLKSGDLVNSWVEYDASSGIFNISVSYSTLKPKEPMLSFPLDLDHYVNDFMYVGFSGSTQGSTEVHSIEWWSFSSSFNSNSPPPPTATLMNPTANIVKSKPPSLAPSDSHLRVVTAGAFVLALFAGALIWVYSKKLKHVKKSESFPSEIIKMPKEFRYKELKAATRCFDANRIIGHGWCHEKGEILLVYDLMPNGSLDKALFEARTPLPWAHRQKILLGVASALAYLHQECDHQIIHRDVKTSNIMLDEGFNAKLGDFGLARQIEHDKSPDATVAAGTMGYLAPEYLQTGRATEKTDVFSYGAVVLEVASGRRPIERNANAAAKVGANGNLVEWVWSLRREGRLLAAADATLEGDFDEGEMRRVLLVGLACSHPDPLARPTMRGVVQMLVGEAQVPIVPKAKPSMSFSTSHLLLSLQDSVSDCNDMINFFSSSSENSHIGQDLV